MNNRGDLIKFSKTQFIFVIAGFVLCSLASIFLLQPAIIGDYPADLENVTANNLPLRVNQRQDQLLAQAYRVATSIRPSELVRDGDITKRTLEEATLKETIPFAARVSQGSGGFDLKPERLLDNPNRHVSYKPNVELTNQPTSKALFYLIPGLLFLLVATIGVLVGAKSIFLVEADTKLLQLQLEDGSTGADETRASSGMQAFSALSALLNKFSEKKAVPAAVTPLTCKQDEESGLTIKKIGAGVKNALG